MSKTVISSKIILDSINDFDNRITTLSIVMPRIILAEYNTHRALSRNSASSRAIPFEKMVDVVMTNPFIPLKWMKNHPGMQGTEYLLPNDAFWCEKTWLVARDHAVYQAKILNERYELSKQMTNRLLEPFMWTTVCTTATEWENFVGLRAHEDAEIHMQTLAYSILDSLNTSIPLHRKAGEWHIPYRDGIDKDKLTEILYTLNKEKTLINESYLEHAIIDIASARVARTSYTLPNSENKHLYDADIKLTYKLTKGGHWSPLESCSMAMSEEQMEAYSHYDKIIPAIFPLVKERGVCGNFRGWIQYRKFFENENRTDSRLIKHKSPK